MTNIKGIIFDLDMTLIDSKEAEHLRNSRKWSDVYNLIPKLKPYEGIPELLRKIRNKYRTTLVSSSPRSYCEKVISFHNWSFDFMICYHDTNRHKPDPEPMLKAVEYMGFLKSNILSIGDKDIDIVASNQAGVVSGACLWGTEDKTRLINSKPQVIFNTVQDLTNFI